MKQPARYESPEAFAAALTRKLKLIAAQETRNLAELRREFILQRFLARLFDPVLEGSHRWILKGGSGLLVRYPGSRHTRDIDLQHEGTDAAIRDLELAASLPLDHFRFELGRPSRLTGRREGIRVILTATLGAKTWDSVPIDLATGGDEPIGAIDVLVLESVVDIEDIPPLPPIRLYPLPAQIAEKLCAMYGSYSSGVVSTRYHDLIDLVTIIENSSLSADQTLRAITLETAHRGIRLPSLLVAPGSNWPRGYAAVTAKSGHPSTKHSLDQALLIVSNCVGPLIADQVPPDAIWNCSTAAWQSPR